MKLSHFTLPLGYRAFGLAARFALVYVAAAYLSEQELKAYNFILATNQLITYGIGLELYQIVHRDIAQQKNVEGVYTTSLDHHWVYLWAATVLALVVALGVAIATPLPGEIPLAIMSGVSFLIFIEIYRYAGLYLIPAVGEIGYAVRGLVSLSAAAYIYLARSAARSHEIVAVIILADVCGIVAMRRKAILQKIAAPRRITRPALMHLARYLLQRWHTARALVTSAMLLRLQGNLDKLTIFVVNSPRVTGAYLFSSALAISIIGLFEATLNNTYVPRLIRREIDERRFIQLYWRFGAILVGLVLGAGVLAYLVDIQDRFSLPLFLVIGISQAIISSSQGYYFIAYHRSQDTLNTFGNSVVVLVQVIVLTILVIGDQLTDVALMAWQVITAVVIVVVRYSIFRKSQKR